MALRIIQTQVIEWKEGFLGILTLIRSEVRREFRNEASGSNDAMKRLMSAHFSPHKPLFFFSDFKYQKSKTLSQYFTFVTEVSGGMLFYTWEEKKLRFESDEEAAMGRRSSGSGWGLRRFSV